MSNSFGLSASELQVIIDTIKVFDAVEEALIFGSRALGTHKRGSDIDIVLRGKSLEITATQISGILNDESPLPYFFDVLDYDTISNVDLKNHIDRIAISFYKKSDNKHVA